MTDRPVAEWPEGEDWSDDPTAWDEPTAADRAAAGDASRRSARRVLAGIGLLVVAALAVSVLAAVLHRQQPGVEYRYVIPHGTSERLAAGEELDILPARIEMRTQDTLVLENRDHEPFSVGGLTVGGDQTMTYRFSKPGTYGGSCQLHAGGTVDIVVI